MDLKKKKLLMRKNILYGMILLTTGIVLEAMTFHTDTLSFNYNILNLNITEVDTSYDVEEIKTSSIPANVSQMSNPIVDTSWGWPTSQNYGITTYYSYGHPALDIVVYDGNYEIYSASSGVVVTDSYKWDGGNYLIIKQDNGYYALYCHLSDKTVGLNTRVEKGQVIGHMGRTGRATGVHLHYSIWKGYPYYGGYSINPFNFY